MNIKIHPAPVLGGRYDLRPLEALQLHGARTADVGLVRMGAGHRSPPEGFRAGARHEIAYVISGETRIDTAEGSRTAGAGDVVVLSPAEAHATTALVDATIFYVVIDAAAKG